MRCAAPPRKELERLCRYITAGDCQRMAQRDHAGQVVLQLKSPDRDGTTQVVMSPLQFMQQRLAALVPPPRLNVIRFHSPTRLARRRA